MADLTVESAVLQDGTLTIKGTGFTRTTTYVEFDGNAAAFDINEAGEIVVTEVPEGVTEVDVSKGEITQTAPIHQGDAGAASGGGTSGSEQPIPPSGDTDQSTAAGAEEPYKTATPDFTPGDITDEDKATTSNVSEEDLRDAANAGAEAKAAQPEPDRTPLGANEHLPGQDFRTRVENTAAGDLDMDPRQPYPTGNPPDPRETFHRLHGYYKDEKDGEGTAA